MQLFGGKPATTKKPTPAGSFKVRYHMPMDEAYDRLFAMRMSIPYSNNYIERALRSVGTPGLALESTLYRMEQEIFQTRALLLRVMVRKEQEKVAEEDGYDVDIVVDIMEPAFYRALRHPLDQKKVTDVMVERATKGALAWVQVPRTELEYSIADEVRLLSGILPDLRRVLGPLGPRVSRAGVAVSKRVPLSVEMEVARLSRVVEARAEGLRMLRCRIVKECLPRLWKRTRGIRRKPKKPKETSTFLDKFNRKLTRYCGGKRKAKAEAQSQTQTAQGPSSKPTKNTTLQKTMSNGSGPRTEAALVQIKGAEANQEQPGHSSIVFGCNGPFVGEGTRGVSRLGYWAEENRPYGRIIDQSDSIDS